MNWKKITKRTLLVIVLIPILIILLMFTITGYENARANRLMKTLGEFEGFTHFPTDFHLLLDENMIGAELQSEEWGEGVLDPVGHRPIMPYYEYTNTNHTEGPRKNYFYDYSPLPHANVYLVADSVLFRGGLFKLGNIEELEGEPVHVDVWVSTWVSEDIEVAYEHISFRDEIFQQIINAPGKAVVLPAGTHIGYIHYPPWRSMDSSA
jgi:hypothetical protein